VWFLSLPLSIPFLVNLTVFSAKPGNIFWNKIWRNIVQVVYTNNFSSNIFPIIVCEKMCADYIVCSNLGLNELMRSGVELG
jgi:hypothetical protein